MNFKYIDRQGDVEALLPVLMARPSWGVDTETTGLDPHLDKVILAQIGNESEQYVIDTRKVSLEPLRPFYESNLVKKLGHHLKFDYKMLRGTFGIEMEEMRCTYLGERLLEMGKVISNTKGRYALDNCLERREIVDDLNKELQMSFVGHVGDFTMDQLEYAARDVLYTIPHVKALNADLLKVGLGSTWTLESRVLSAFGDMEFVGQNLDVEQWRKVIDRNTKSAIESKAELDVFVEPFCSINMFGDLDSINYDSPAQLLDLFKRMGIKINVRDAMSGEEREILIDKTDKATQKKLAHLPIIKMIGRYRAAKKGMGTYGENYIRAIHPKTGRIHPEVDQIGTATGRIANRGEVSFLNIPRDNAYRNALVASQDWVIETDDFSGCELRILADLSGEDTWIKAFLNNEDVHCTVATELYGVTVTKKNENAKLRTPAKSLNFGLAYGMGPGKLCDDLNGAGFHITFSEAKKLYDKYISTYKKAIDFLRSSGRTASRLGYLENVNGRRRYWDLPNPTDDKKYPDGQRGQEYRARISQIQREGGNFAIQSVNADMSKLAMIKLRKYAKQNGIRTEMVNQIYDEVVTHTHKDDSESFAPTKRNLMIEAANNSLRAVPMGVDGHIGRCWHKD